MAVTSLTGIDGIQKLKIGVSAREDEKFTQGNASCSIFRLPYEVRLQIYSFIFTVDPNTTLSHAAHPPQENMTRRLPSMSLLLTCSQIYYEARLLPLRCNTFDFFRWYSSNIFECRQFLRKLQPWQISQIRNMQLAITEADLRGPEPDLLESDTECTLLDLCQSVGPFLRQLDLDISVVFDVNFDWHAAASQWLQNGLSQFKDLRSLRVVLGRNVTVLSKDLEAFQTKVARLLPKCTKIEIQSLKIEAEKEEAERKANRLAMMKQAGMPSDMMGIEVHQTVISAADFVFTTSGT